MPHATKPTTDCLRIVNCRFTGKIPASIGALQNLRSFIIYEQCLHSTNASGDCFYMNRVKEDGWLNENVSRHGKQRLATGVRSLLRTEKGFFLCRVPGVHGFALIGRKLIRLGLLTFAFGTLRPF